MLVASGRRVLPSGGPPFEKGILLVASGSAVPRAQKAYETIDRRTRQEFADATVYWAYASAFIRGKLAEQGVQIDSAGEALARMRQAGIKTAVVQCLQVSCGREYEAIVDEVRPFESSFESLKIGRPLLTSVEDLGAFGEALKTVVPAARRPEEAVVLVGHGDPRGIGDPVLLAAARELRKSDACLFVGTVSGRPSFEEARAGLLNSGARKAYLIPMMIVAGAHVENDMAGVGAHSWRTVLERDGIACVPVLKGLGESDAVAAIFADHIRQA